MEFHEHRGPNNSRIRMDKCHVGMLLREVFNHIVIHSRRVISRSLESVAVLQVQIVLIQLAVLPCSNKSVVCIPFGRYGLQYRRQGQSGLEPPPLGPWPFRVMA
jgi:hypothetical protein